MEVPDSATTTYDLIVVGAGIHGVIALHRYHQINPNHNILLLDSAKKLGGVWSFDRVYPNLLTHNYYGTFEYSDKVMPPERVNKFGYVGALTVSEYLRDYVIEFGLEKLIRMGVEVKRAERLAAGKDRKGFHLHCQLTSIGNTSTESTIFKSKRLILATGLTSSPFIPPIPRQNFTPPTYHFRDLGLLYPTLSQPESPFSTITIYGGSKSAFDAVHLCLSLKKKVHWVIRTTGAGPATLIPPKVLGLNSLRFAHARLFSWLNPSIYALHQPAYNTAQRFFTQNWLGILLLGWYWRYTSSLVASWCGFDKSENGRKLRPTNEDMCAFWISGNVGVACQEGLFEGIHDNPDLSVHRASIVGLEGMEVVLDDGERFGTDAVVFATGWKIGDAPFEEEELVELGLPAPLGVVGEDVKEKWRRLEEKAEGVVGEAFPVLRERPVYNKPEVGTTPYRLWRRMVPTELKGGGRDIVFLGKVHTGSTAMLAEVQAIWAVDYLSGELDVPERDERERECAEFTVWCRMRYLALGEKMPYTLYDYQTYIDALLLDIGLNPRRKGRKIKEWLEPYTPKDYKNLVEEYIALRKETKSGKADSQDT